MGPKAKQFASKLMAVDKLHFRLAFFLLSCATIPNLYKGAQGKVLPRLLRSLEAQRIRRGKHTCL